MPEELKALGEALHRDVEDLIRELREDRREHQKRFRAGLIAAVVAVVLLCGLLVFNNFTTRQQTRTDALCPLFTAAQNGYDPVRRAQLPTEEQRRRYDEWYRELGEAIQKLGCPAAVRAPDMPAPTTS